MRLDEIAIPKAKGIIYSALENLSKEVGIVDDIKPFEKNVKVKADDNMVTVKFRLENQGPAAGSMSFDGFAGNMDQQDYEKEAGKMESIADELVIYLGDKINIEDYTIYDSNPGYRKAVNLFMVSDDFIG